MVEAERGRNLPLNGLMFTMWNQRFLTHHKMSALVCLFFSLLFFHQHCWSILNTIASASYFRWYIRCYKTALNRAFFMLFVWIYWNEIIADHLSNSTYTEKEIKGTEKISTHSRANMIKKLANQRDLKIVGCQAVAGI